MTQIILGKCVLFPLIFVITISLFQINVLAQLSNTISIDSSVTNHPNNLGEPYFVEKGKITGQKVIDPNRTEYTFTANGTINGNIQVTNTGTFLSISKGENITYGEGQSVLMTVDGREKANHTFFFVGNVTEDGKPIFAGASVGSTDSKGKLSFLNNGIGIYKGEFDAEGNIISKEWKWN